MKKYLFILFCFAVKISFSQSDTTFYEKGIASYYAKAFEGRRCSSGEKFRHDSLTAAHKSLKYGTRVKVVNLNNDSVVVVRINDRLPKNSKRCIDLTRRGAKQLNFLVQGLTKVKIELIKDTVSINALAH